ncbi:MAG: AraC-like DNA-binding protein [Oleispira sp.]|jgi:AraC-like DNA-binding protein
MKLGDISVSYVEILHKAMLVLDSNPQLILQQFGLNDITLASPDARISIPRFMRLGFASIQYTQKPWLGLEMGAQTRVTNLGVAGLMALSSSNLKSACKALCHYELLSSYNARGQSAFYLSDGFGIAQFYSISPYNRFNLFVVDSVLSGWYSLAKWLTGKDDCIEAICFEFDEPEYSHVYNSYFDCEVRFSQPYNAVIIKPQALDYKVVYGCASTYELLKRQANADLEKVRMGLNFSEKVARVITPLLNGSTPTLDQVAEQLNMAPWTVRRKLVDEEVTFQQVLNNTRRDLAVSYVKDTAFTLGEIAYLLGFGSPTAFQRAFKRWMGVAPGIYRHDASIHLN